MNLIRNPNIKLLISAFQMPKFQSEDLFKASSMHNLPLAFAYSKFKTNFRDSTKKHI